MVVFRVCFFLGGFIVNITIKQGRKYQTKAGHRVEIDSLDSPEDALNGRVLGRVFFPTAGQCPCNWDAQGVLNPDGTPSDLDLVDIGEDDRDRRIALHDAIAIREINSLLDYVMVDGIDPQVFDLFEGNVQATNAQVVLGLLRKVYESQI